MISTVFDIETEPRPQDEVLALFDPNAVKLGNLKDPAKIDKKIEDDRQKHLDQAALSPLTGKVLAIGYEDAHEIQIESAGARGVDESVLLDAFWEQFEQHHSQGRSLIGFNSAGFDLPFLWRRSLLRGVAVPDQALERGRFWSPTFIDLMELWRCGDRTEYVSLDTLAKYLDIKGKPDGVTGADFAQLWHGTPEEREQAKSYLENDLRMTRAVAIRFGVS